MQCAARASNGPNHLGLRALQEYTQSEVQEIIEIRCEEEDVEMTDDAKELLTKIAMETSLRYGIHMVCRATHVARTRSHAYTLALTQTEHTLTHTHAGAHTDAALQKQYTCHT